MLKTINILTTAALPWRTGTAILPLLRSHYLAQKGLDVRLYIPWIPPKEQRLLFGEDTTFASFDEQEACIRDYLPGPRVRSWQIEFYPATYKAPLGSIFPTCPLAKRLRECDWLLLEEPEHLNWLHPWNRYRQRAKRVTGIVMTNYFYYCAQAFPKLPILPWLLERYNRWLMQHHCDDIAILGNVIRPMPKVQTLNTSGIHPTFFQTLPIVSNSQKIYFMGKLIWEKGFRELIDLLATTQTREIDIFGIGKDQPAIETYAQRQGIHFHYQGNSTQPAKDLQDYKLFINTSRSEVTCTTTAEALGQGKFVLIPDVPGNDLFYSFKNCLVYTSPQEFRQQLEFALSHAPVNDPQIQSLSWEAAVDRLLAYYEQTPSSI